MIQIVFRTLLFHQSPWRNLEDSEIAYFIWQDAQAYIICKNITPWVGTCLNFGFAHFSGQSPTISALLHNGIQVKNKAEVLLTFRQTHHRHIVMLNFKNQRVLCMPKEKYDCVLQALILWKGNKCNEGEKLKFWCSKHCNISKLHHWGIHGQTLHYYG